jgi:hypothetical protein
MQGMYMRKVWRIRRKCLITYPSYSILEDITMHGHQESRGEDIESTVQTIPSFLLVIQTKQQQRWMVEYGNT